METIAPGAAWTFESTDGRLWDVAQSCAILHVSRSKLYELMSEGRLLYKQVTQRTRLISDRDIQQYLDSCSSLPNPRLRDRRAKKAS